MTICRTTTTPVLLLLLLFTVLAPVVADEGEALSRDGKRLLDSARRMAKATRFKERQEELLGKKMVDVGPEEMARVIDALRAEPKPGKSHAGVTGFLVTRYLTGQYGELAATKIDDLYSLRATKDPEKMIGLMTTALMLPDFRLANELVLAQATSPDREVRLRVTIAISDLITYGSAGPAAEKAFTERFADPDPAVRAVAIRRGFEVQFDPAFDLAMARLADTEKATATVRGEPEELVPGKEALEQLVELTRVEENMTWEKYRMAEPAVRKALYVRFTAWWEKWGKFFPPPGHREAIFKRKPSTSKVIVVPRDETTATFRLWSTKDRTRVRVHIDEINLAATSLSDWRVNCHIQYTASGMRPDEGEAYPRGLFTGTPYILARKKIGCYVLVFQNLIDGRVQVRLDFHDPER